MTQPEPFSAEDTTPSAPGSKSLAFGRIARNMLAMGTSQVITMASTAVLALILPRYLGDVLLGKYAFALAFVAFLSLLTSLGTGPYLTKAVARSPSWARVYTPSAMAMRIPLTVLAAAVGVVAINLLGYDQTTKVTVYFLMLSMAFSAVLDITVSSLQGLENMRPVAVAQVVNRVGHAAAVVAMLMLGLRLPELALAGSIGLALALLITLVMLVRVSGMTLSPRMRLWRSVFMGGLPFFVWQGALLTYGKIDLLMLSGMTSDAVVGWYAAAYRLISIHTFIPVIVMTVVYPALSSAATRDIRQFNSIARRALQGVLLATVPIAAGTILLSDRIIETFRYPQEFEHSIPLLIILSLHTPLVAADMIIGTALNARDKQRQWALMGVAAAFLNPAMNAFMIPFTQSAYGNGAIGAGAATLLTELFMMGMGLWLLPRGVFDWRTASVALRTLGAAAAMIGPVWLTREMPIAVPVIVGALVYGSFCLTLRAVSLSDVRRISLYVIERQKARALSPS